MSHSAKHVIFPITRLKRDARKTATENRAIIRQLARKVAEEGRLAVVFDHKSILNTNGDPENHGLGIALTIAKEDFQRKHYFLDYIPTSSTDMESTVRLARDVLEVSLSRCLYKYRGDRVEK